MRNYILILLIGLLFSCRKDKVDPEIPLGALYKITAKEKLQDSLEYNNGKVSRILSYSHCDTPYATVEYGYSGDRITSIRSGSRGLTSSWSGALCDPNGKFEYQNYSLEYDAQGRFNLVTGNDLLIRYEYAGQMAKLQMSDKKGNLSRTNYLKFDNNGNVVEQQIGNIEGIGITRFEYDNHPNPMHGLSTNGWPDPFTGPNNVVRSRDASGNVQWERKFTYNAAGQPLTCDEGNGILYEYHYR